MTVSEKEWRTRKGRVDPRVDSCGWRLPERGTTAVHRPYRKRGRGNRERPRPNHALWADNRIVVLVEAKKLAVGPQNVRTQAERCARGLRKSSYNFDGLRVPFLYATTAR